MREAALYIASPRDVTQRDDRLTPVPQPGPRTVPISAAFHDRNHTANKSLVFSSDDVTLKLVNANEEKNIPSKQEIAMETEESGAGAGSGGALGAPPRPNEACRCQRGNRCRHRAVSLA